ncbi:MAG: PTS sugar transporter subunit IIB [Coriobacteriaceae bacterium]|nr:PTS sugar transporter subunit IIB [Coriobacteriaceae bacterium]
MNAIVLVGHGSLPEAMRASVEMIVGKRDDIHTACLDPNDGKEDLDRKLAALEGVLADLMGGSPCTAALELYAADARVSVVSGMNLAMVISAVMESAEPEALVAAGHEAIHDVKVLAAGTERAYAPARQIRRSAPVDTSAPQCIMGVRVDARGIHGQVATAWVPRYDATRIVVVDDVAVRDETQKMALKMAKPSAVKLSILSARRAMERLSDEHSYPGERILVVMTRVQTLAALDELGYRFDLVDLGNIPNRPDTTTYAKCVNLTDVEAQIVRDLAEKGTAFTARQVPADPQIDFMQSLNQ